MKTNFEKAVARAKEKAKRTVAEQEKTGEATPKGYNARPDVRAKSKFPLWATLQKNVKNKAALQKYLEEQKKAPIVENAFQLAA